MTSKYIFTFPSSASHENCHYLPLNSTTMKALVIKRTPLGRKKLSVTEAGRLRELFS